MTFAKEEKLDDVIAMSNENHRFHPSMLTNLSLILIGPRAKKHLPTFILSQLDSIIINSNQLVLVDEKKQTPLHHFALCMHSPGCFFRNHQDLGCIEANIPFRAGVVAALIIVGSDIHARDIYGRTAEDIFLRSPLAQEPNHPVFKLLRGDDPVEYLRNLLNKEWCEQEDIGFALSRLPQGFEDCVLEYRGIAQARNLGAGAGFLGEKGCPFEISAVCHGFFSAKDGRALAAVNRATSHAARIEVQLRLGVVLKEQALKLTPC